MKWSGPCVSPTPVYIPEYRQSKRTVAVAAAAFRRQSFVANFLCSGIHFGLTVCAQMFVSAMSTIRCQFRPSRSLVAICYRPLSVIVDLVFQYIGEDCLFMRRNIVLNVQQRRVRRNVIVIGTKIKIAGAK